MTQPGKNIAVLGSTGSIGRNALDVIANSGGELSAKALSAHNNLNLLREQAIRFRPRWIVLTDPEKAGPFDRSGLPKGVDVLVGPEGIARAVGDPEIDMVLSAIVGSAGLQGTWAALEAGKPVALANKESLVMAGPLVMRLAEEHQAQVLPVDSEHSAVFQAMQSGRRSEVYRVILTASGGPFRTRTIEQLAQVSVAEALAHPTWDMGPKVTIDSATLMNKALEIIEARWLFNIPSQQIEVMIHPQSIVHSMVEFVDGSVIAQLSPPDMKLPIQYALTWPSRCHGVASRVDWRQAMHLDFEPPDFQRFGALELGLEVARMGGTSGAVLNGANEAAVAAFLCGRLGFDQIVPVCRDILRNHNYEPTPTLADVLAMDRWARKEVLRWIAA
ncbi:MAG: 1-deoxy-D-xylulose-5-phosphate reductoisomerase [Thermoguttaceae bacterium]